MLMSMPQRILIAPSGFKESLSAEDVADAIAAGVRRALPGVAIDMAPIPDGGEGTAYTLAMATTGQLVRVRVHGPAGGTVDAHYARLGGAASGTAVIEMAAAAGLSLVPRDRRDPCATTTYGVGQLIAAALDDGAERIIVGCGDSGTCDGGAGALQALGARVLDSTGADLPPGGRHLARAAFLDLSGLHPRLADVDIVLACNPNNVLCGEKGVAPVFARQKGATDEDVEVLSHALKNWATILERDGNPVADVRTGLGTGASGGLGAGLAAGIGATLLSRFDALLDSGLCGIDLDTRIGQADLVITAEGSIDFQTPRGKVPAEVARRATDAGVPVIALAGSIGRGAAAVHDAGIDAMASIVAAPMSLADAVANGWRLLSDAAEQTMRMILIGASVASRQNGRQAVAVGG
ncbi:Glycerate kinase [Mycobacterium basiliense]|uniref:Glycerate kinase n=1 Tax=Mycobacterium basiliense TaxID=2094119 RepID=A0A3S4FPL7_9MYCO|nr:glycerate kinase [Mycobacterium basiliense]VDM89922.1 Glycerate kinase [Mycobacterium basiliense]